MLTPLASLGPGVDETLRRSPWRNGTALVDESGRAIHAAEGHCRRLPRAIYGMGETAWQGCSGGKVTHCAVVPDKRMTAPDAWMQVGPTHYKRTVLADAERIARHIENDRVERPRIGGVNRESCRVAEGFDSLREYLEQFWGQALSAFVPAAGGPVEIVLKPTPQPGDGPGRTSLFQGPAPKAVDGKSITIPSGRSYLVKAKLFSAKLNSK